MFVWEEGWQGWGMSVRQFYCRLCVWEICELVRAPLSLTHALPSTALVKRHQTLTVKNSQACHCRVRQQKEFADTHPYGLGPGVASVGSCEGQPCWLLHSGGHLLPGPEAQSPDLACGTHTVNMCTFCYSCLCSPSIENSAWETLVNIFRINDGMAEHAGSCVLPSSWA